MRRFSHFTFLLSLSFLLVGATVFGQSTNPVQESGKVADVSKTLAKINRKHKTPALAAAVVRSGRTVATGVTGVRKARSRHKAEIDDKFHIGSCTKSMTATLCGLLVDEGKLSWESTISEVMPEVAEAIDAGYRDVTLEQLLCHRAGLPEDRMPDLTIWPRIMVQSGEIRGQRREYIRLSLAGKPAYPAGTDFAYANAGFVVAGAMCEAVTGKSYETLMGEMLFEPLGITSAGFGAPGTASRHDQPWGHLNVLGMYSAQEPGPLADNPEVLGPSGRVHLSMGDWAKYVALHLDAACGRNRMLSVETWKRLHSDPFEQDYGFGWAHRELERLGGRALIHDGSNRSWYAVVAIFPAKETAILVATNAGDIAAERACNAAVAQLYKLKGE